MNTYSSGNTNDSTLKKNKKDRFSKDEKYKVEDFTKSFCPEYDESNIFKCKFFKTNPEIVQNPKVRKLNLIKYFFNFLAYI